MVNFKISKAMNTLKTTTKTRITTFAQLHEGDVVFVFEKELYGHNKCAADPKPRKAFMRVASIRYSRSGILAYDPVSILIGSEAEIVQRAVCSDVVTNSEYGLCTGLSDAQHIYRLDNVRNLFMQVGKVFDQSLLCPIFGN